MRLRSFPAVLALVALLTGLLLVLLVPRAVDVARDGGGIKGDEATYVGMAASLGFDGNFTFERADYQRFRDWYAGGPEGIFLKRAGGDALYFGKAYLFGVLAAPFARLGGVDGLLVFNLCALAAIAIAAGAWLSRAAPGHTGPAVAFAVVFVLASVVPLYAFWLTSDLLNAALVVVAYGLLVPPRDGASRAPLLRTLGALLLAAAIFSKPLNLPLAAPAALAAAHGSWRGGVRWLVGIGALVLVYFLINVAVTGELNYQGGERRTFYGTFPYDDAGDTFDSTGVSMTTNTLDTPVGAEGRVAPLLANARYFVVGRHFGLVPFHWPWLVALAGWIVAERRKVAWQWLLVLATIAGALGTVVWMPYTWSGGGGPVGNRYFLSLGIALVFLVPRALSWTAVAAAAVGFAFVTPVLAHPFVATKQPWTASLTRPFRLLPVELTGASDLPVILDQRRGRLPQGQQPTVFVSLLDEGAEQGRNGWLMVRPRAASELLVRSPVPLTSVTTGVKSDSACAVRLQPTGGAETTLTLGVSDRRDASLAPEQTFSRDSFVFVLAVDASACDRPIEVAMQGTMRTP